MLDLQFICENADAVAENCRNRGVDVDLEKLLTLREQRSRLIKEGDDLRHDQRETSAKIPQTKDADEKQPLIARGKELRGLIQDNESQLKQFETELRHERL